MQAEAWSALADCLRAEGRSGDAEEAKRRALSLYRQAYGEFAANNTLVKKLM